MSRDQWRDLTKLITGLQTSMKTLIKEVEMVKNKLVVNDNEVERPRRENQVGHKVDENEPLNLDHEMTLPPTLPMETFDFWEDQWYLETCLISPIVIQPINEDSEYPATE